MSERAIGIFDSGIGGLTVAAEIKKQMPGERILYLGDTARLPFGTKSPLTIQKYSLQNARFLLNLGIKLLVVACNTATAWALEHIKEFSPVPVIGVIDPGCKAAASNTKNNRIGVIGTSATIRSEAYPAGIRQYRPEAHVISRQTPLFVPIVEEGWLDHKATDLIIAEYLTPMLQEKIDTLVLGCTHYPLLKESLGRFFGDEVELICSSETTASEVKDKLNALKIRNDNESLNNDRYFLTDHSATFQRIMRLFLPETRYQVEQVDISDLSER